MAAHEAEIYAAVDAARAKEVVHLHRLLQDLGEHSTAAQVLMADDEITAPTTAARATEPLTASKRIKLPDTNKRKAACLEDWKAHRGSIYIFENQGGAQQNGKRGDGAASSRPRGQQTEIRASGHQSRHSQ
jgi:hypothetical protein